jgi:hypothetical protein
MQTVCTVDDGEISTVVCTVMRTPGSIFSTLSLFLRYDLSINICRNGSQAISWILCLQRLLLSLKVVLFIFVAYINLTLPAIK